MSTVARPAVTIEPLTVDDWPAVRAIYEQGIETGDATLEPAPPEWPLWDATHLATPRLVARRDGVVVGFCVLSGYSERAVYRGVAWESVYVAEAARAQGVGRALLEALVVAADGAGFWTILAGIQAENVASLALHQRCGFRTVGVHERLGRDPAGRWRDVVIVERLIPENQQ